MNRPLLGFVKLAMAVSIVQFVVAVQTLQAAEICDNGAMVPSEYCRFFVHYNSDKPGVLDIRISDALKISDKDSSKTRSIGLIIAISKYPGLKADLPAAAIDGSRVADFLIKGQRFDEVIVLRDEDASVDNINFFLKTYLPARGEMFDKKARLLIAYSGHGRYGTTDGSADKAPAFVLSNATDIDGAKGMYEMPALNSQLQILSARYFHVLTLINACFGSGIYGLTFGGSNSNAFSKPGAYAIAAGDDKTEVYSLVEGRGSVFFDTIITGVTSGVADERYGKSYMIKLGAKKEYYAGITRTLSLFVYLNDQYMDVNQSLEDKGESLRLSDAWIGATESPAGPGGFFFINDPSADSLDKGTQAIASNEGNFANITPVKFSVNKSFDLEVLPTPKEKEPPSKPEKPVSNEEKSIEIPYGPVSSIPGRPDVRIFKAPDIYPIKGHDISSEDGFIDWGLFGKVSSARFVYARVVGWKGVDKSFKGNWSSLGGLKLDRGAYFKYDFCRSPQAQIETAKENLPKDPEMLPIGILLVHPAGEDEQQLSCFKKVGIDGVRKNMLQFAEMAQEYYGKTPIFYGNHNNLSRFLDGRFDNYMIWMGFWGRSGVKLGGSNPWTLWQYSGNESAPGIGSKTESEVFFGTEEQYTEFKKGKSNVALSAVK